jgi:hypothetical protein
MPSASGTFDWARTGDNNHTRLDRRAFKADITIFEVLIFVNTPPPKTGGFRLRLKAGLVRPLADSDGGCASSYLEIIVRLWRCLVLEIRPDLIGNVSTAGDPISSAPQVAAPITLAQYPELAQQFVGAPSLQILHRSRQLGGIDRSICTWFRFIAPA